MNLGTRRLTDVIVLLVIVCVLVFWSARLFTEWGSDYGAYYVGAYYLNSDYKLYQELFDHKGPMYYLFLKSIGTVIGWGHLQSYISLLISMLVFYIPAYFIIRSFTKRPKIIVFSSIASLLLLYQQDTHSSIAFFQSGLLLTSFYLLISGYNSWPKTHLAFTLLVLAVFTRVDAIIYLPIYLVAPLLSHARLNISKTILNFAVWPLIAIGIFYALASLFGFTFSQYVVHNFEFNQWYQNDGILRLIYRPISYQILFSSLLMFTVLLIFSENFSGLPNRLRLLFNEVFSRTKISEKMYGLLLVNLITLCAIGGWLLTMSDKGYHLLVLSVPLFYYVLNNLGMFEKHNLVIPYILFGSYGILLTVAPIAEKLAKDPECTYSHYCESASFALDGNAIKALHDFKNETVTIVGGSPWIYFFSGKRPARAINDWWLYETKIPFLTDHLSVQHSGLVEQPTGYKFLIYNEYITTINDRSPLLSELLEKAELVESFKQYSIFQLR